MAAYTRPSLVECIALVVLSCIAAGDLITYSTPSAFLGQALAAQGASSSQIMLAYGLSGATTALACVLVLLCQSIPVVANLAPASKWGVVVVAQFLNVTSSVIMLAWPVTPAVMASRALQGAAAASYLVYCLSLLVELSPKQHLATGIAAMAAGVTAGDSIAPVIGAIIYDRAGFRAAFLLPAAVGILVLLLALLMYPIWQWPHMTSKQMVKHSFKTVNSSNSKLQQLSRQSQPLNECPSDICQCAEYAAPTNGVRVAVQELSESDIKPLYPAQEPAIARQPQPITVNSSSSKDCEDCSASDIAASGRMPATSIVTKDLCNVSQASLVDFTDVSSGSSCHRLPRHQKVQPAGSQLNFGIVWSSLKDPVIFCQCVVLFLEQMVRATLTVVLPSTMGTAMWLVGVVYVANVVGAVSSPFAIDYIITRVPKTPTHALATILSLTMGLTSVLSVAFSTRIALLCIFLFLYGASQSAVGMLVYVHVARRLDHIGHHTGIHVSMCMYVFADTAAGGLGNLTGGALQHQSWGIQLGVTALGAAVATCFGVVVWLTSYVREKQHKAEHAIEDSQVIIEEPTVGHLPQVIIEQSLGHF